MTTGNRCHHAYIHLSVLWAISFVCTNTYEIDSFWFTWTSIQLSENSVFVENEIDLKCMFSSVYKYECQRSCHKHPDLSHALSSMNSSYLSQSQCQSRSNVLDRTFVVKMRARSGNKQTFTIEYHCEWDWNQRFSTISE